MNKFWILIAIVVAVMTNWLTENRGDAQVAEQASPTIVRHVVLFKFKDDSKPEDVRKVEQAFVALRDKLKQIADFEWGTDVSTEKLSKGFTHCFFVTFHNEKGRDDYLPSDAHQEFVTLVKPLLDDVLVVDYVPQR